MLNSNEHQIKVGCNWPITKSRNTNIQILNDNHMKVMFQVFEKQHAVVLFLEKIQRNLGQMLKHDRVYSHMLDLEVDSASFMSPQRDMDWTQQHLSGPSLGGTSSASNDDYFQQGEDVSDDPSDDDEEGDLQK